MSFLQGTSVALSAQFYEYAGGPGAVLTDVTVRVTKVGDSGPTLGPVSEGVGNPADGLYTYLWSTSLDTDPGNYTVVWEGTDADLEPVQASEVITITAAILGTWASTADVEDITGVTVTEAQLRRAQSVIDMVSGRTYEIHDLLVRENRARDLRWLQQAVAYQAAWMISQPDMFTRMNVTSVNQDTSQAQMGASALTLAPLARRALNRVSWMGTRSVQVQRARSTGRGVQPAGSPVYDYDGEEPLWRPL
ncbi:hypothetical protein [Streptomyces griseoaurantiacus]|uniref:Uncharacterized protein n=1 Tax=Streptomyces griseoaurantiacus TaxID=68213 RepID=A0A7W2DSI6_9ACTN|nr:hypothetical protein [Streptomyces griseoaurantiacus]MBA5222226.1 hypothetical protein [Streptomyces griseoaurantiacus]